MTSSGTWTKLKLLGKINVAQEVVMFKRRARVVRRIDINTFNFSGKIDKDAIIRKEMVRDL